MSPLGDLARQDDYELPDVGPPLVPSGPPFSPGVPAVNQAMGALLAPRPRDPQSPIAYRTASPLVNITEQDIADATEAAMASSGGGLGIKAYHSSPHDFDRFDLSKIGTGEGAQVYGHGLYFAENPAVSGQGGQYWKAFSERFREGPEGKAVQYLKSSDMDRSAAIKKLEDDLYAHNQSVAQGTTYMPPAEDARYGKQLMQARDLLASDKPVGPRTYEVDIKTDPAHFLDWDKPLSRQSEPVQRMLQPFGFKAQPELMRAHDDALVQALTTNSPIAVPKMPFDPIGSDIYRNKFTRSPEHASRVMEEAGIPGIRYLDQGSRMHASDVANAEKTIESLKARGQTHMLDAWQEELARLKKVGASSNYVVFDPNRIDILRKYGIAGAAPLGIGALAAQDQYNQP